MVKMKQLLEAGVHFGHQTRKWNPKMSGYIFAARNNIHVIDLQKTVKNIEEAVKFVRELVSKNGRLLFVGTKPQAAEIIKEEAKRCGAFYVSERWWGGMLTNFSTIRKSVERFKEMERVEQEGFKGYTKKEIVGFKREKSKLEKGLSGIVDMEDLPDAIFIVDIIEEKIAVAEASKLGIPMVALVDTNADPELIDYIIPGNDDAIRSIKLITKVIADAVVEAKDMKLKGAIPKEETEDLKEEDINIEAEDRVSTAVEGEDERSDFGL